MSVLLWFRTSIFLRTSLFHLYNTKEICTIEYVATYLGIYLDSISKSPETTSKNAKKTYKTSKYVLDSGCVHWKGSLLFTTLWNYQQTKPPLRHKMFQTRRSFTRNIALPFIMFSQKPICLPCHEICLKRIYSHSSFFFLAFLPSCAGVSGMMLNFPLWTFPKLIFFPSTNYILDSPHQRQSHAANVEPNP